MWGVSSDTWWEQTVLGGSSTSGWRPYVDFTENMELIPGFVSGKSLVFVFCFIQLSSGKFVSLTVQHLSWSRCGASASAAHGADVASLTLTTDTQLSHLCPPWLGWLSYLQHFSLAWWLFQSDLCCFYLAGGRCMCGLSPKTSAKFSKAAWCYLDFTVAS